MFVCVCMRSIATVYCTRGSEIWYVYNQNTWGYAPIKANF